MRLLSLANTTEKLSWRSLLKKREKSNAALLGMINRRRLTRRNYSVERILRLRCKVRRWKVNGDHPGRYSEMGSEKNSIYRMQSLQGSGLFRDGACRLSCAGKRVENFSQRDQHDTGFHVHQHVSETLGSLRPLVPDLLDKLIQLAIERHRLKSTLKTTYTPKTDWYKG